tara:strand:+ start:227 stop:1303 length:1077 start_codon:yes stop_codon:yes gene_type:complete
MNDSEITDIRPAKEFRQTSLSNYKKSDVKKSLITCISNKKIEESCYWSAELICAGHFIDVWEIILLYTSNHIHLGNPKLPIYINMRFNDFKNILLGGYLDNEIKMRNNMKIRKLFAEIICIICFSKKNNTFDYPKIKIDDYNIGLIQHKLEADSIKYGQKIMQKEDPKELFIAINEFAWNISRKIKNAPNAFFWIEWLLNFESICNKEKKRKIKLIAARRTMPVSDTCQKEAIWMVWELLLYESKRKSNGIHEIVKALLNLFCIRFKHSSVRKRKSIIYNAIFLITENVNNDIAIYNEKHKNIIDNVKEKINVIYKQIKKNEVKPQTDYLFNNSINKNLEKTISKLNKMEKLNMIIRN